MKIFRQKDYASKEFEGKSEREILAMKKAKENEHFKPIKSMTKIGAGVGTALGMAKRLGTHGPGGVVMGGIKGAIKGTGAGLAAGIATKVASHPVRYVGNKITEGAKAAKDEAKKFSSKDDLSGRQKSNAAKVAGITAAGATLGGVIGAKNTGELKGIISTTKNLAKDGSKLKAAAEGAKNLVKSSGFKKGALAAGIVSSAAAANHYIKKRNQENKEYNDKLKVAKQEARDSLKSKWRKEVFGK